jgi:hypothetical protein
MLTGPCLTLYVLALRDACGGDGGDGDDGRDYHGYAADRHGDDEPRQRTFLRQSSPS